MQATVDGILDGMHAKAPRLEKLTTTDGPTSSHPHLQDRHGNAFDPDLHQVDADGQPKLSAAGRCMGKAGVVLPRKQRRDDAKPLDHLDQVTRSLDRAAITGEEAEEDDDDTDDDDDAADQAHQVDQVEAAPAITLEQRKKLAKDTAEVAVQLLQAVGKFVAGREGKFQNNNDGDEYGELKESYISWFETMENLVHVSPGWIVAVHTGKYLSRCASTEVGQKRIEKGTSWASSTWSKIRLGFHAWRASATAKQNNGR